MADLLIRNVDSDVVSRIEAAAARQGLSREEYLRREIARVSTGTQPPTTLADLDRFAERFADLGDEAVMSRAWW